jgi:site-specific recombinase XerD
VLCGLVKGSTNLIATGDTTVLPLHTMQAWLGHKNLETTQRYLGVTDTNKLRTQIDAAFGD